MAHDPASSVHEATAFGGKRPIPYVISAGHDHAVSLRTPNWHQHFAVMDDGGFEVQFHIGDKFVAGGYGKIIDGSEALERLQFLLGDAARGPEAPEDVVVEVSYLWVEPEARGLGLARRLIEEIVGTIGGHWGATYAFADVFSQLVYASFQRVLGQPSYAAGRRVRYSKKRQGDVWHDAGLVAGGRGVTAKWIAKALDPFPVLNTASPWSSGSRTYGFQLANRRYASMLWRLP